MAHFGRKMF